MRAVTRMAATGLAVVLFTGGTLLGAAAQTSPSPANDKLTLTIGVTDDMRTANPFRYVTVTEGWVQIMMYEYLIGFSQDTLQGVPALATHWEQSDDGLTWTITLRDGLRWSDGQPMTAHDFAWFGNYVVKNDISQYADSFPLTKKITAPNDTTIVWKTTKPTVQPGLPGNFLLPEHVWGDMTAKEIREYKNFPNPVVSGPFKLTEWEPGQFWKLERNPYFWGPKPAVDQVIFRVFNTSEAEVQALRRGAIDFAEYLSPALFDSLQNAPGVTTHVGGAAGFTNLNFNVDPTDKSNGNPALLDVNVRQAIAHAIDRQTLIDKVIHGYADPGTTVVGPAFPQWHYEPTPEERIDFNLAEANQILDDAGYEDTNNDGVREMPGGGQPLELRLMSVANDDNASKSTAFIKGWLNQIGIAVKSDPVNNTTLLDRYYDLDFDMYIYGWSASGPDPDFILSTFTTKQCLVWSDTCYSNPQYDKLFEQQRAALDPEQRQQLVFDLQRHIYEQVPEMVLWYDNDLEAYRSDRWTGFVQQPAQQGYLLDQWGTYSLQQVRPASGNVSTAAEAEGGVPGGVWAAIGAGIVVLIVVGVLISRRRDEGA
jgi:peptide/nickel transport system substrate-binding protein